MLIAKGQGHFILAEQKVKLTYKYAHSVYGKSMLLNCFQNRASFTAKGHLSKWSLKA